ncbi:hypothetical protein M9Y10_039963 [Tritrichomonas musculus]|uniref:HNH nuclease domain-containing protein n=1 Tax=Tritrichomonas musculus TaxID=1915356 RepID=A0ABR2GSC2_9EUKA
MTEMSEFVTLVNHEDYEILTTYPHAIRRKNDHRVCSETMNNDGYLIVTLNGKIYQKHRIIASQFIENLDNLPFVDHINHDRTDNRIEDLRWCSRSDNNFNRISTRGVQYEFVDDIPDEAIKVLFYETRTEHHEFEEDKYYYYHDEENDEDIFYSKMTDKLYRILHININKSNNKFVSMNDNHKRVAVYINRFKHQHSLD